MDSTFTTKLIQLSLKAAEESEGSTKDLFLAQAARLESFLPKKPKKKKVRK